MLFDIHFWKLTLIFIFNHPMHSVPMYSNSNKQAFTILADIQEVN